MIRQITLMALALASALAGAAERTFGTTESAIAAVYPDHELLGSASGDLDGDGRDDVAVLLRPPQAKLDDRQPQRLRVVVFKANAQRQLEHWTATKPVFDCPHGTTISIARGSLFLGCTSSLGLGGGDNVSGQLQFALRRGTLLLIGDETQIITAMNSPDESWKTRSRNLLTGRIVEREGGSETTHVDPAIKKHAIPLENWGGW